MDNTNDLIDVRGDRFLLVLSHSLISARRRSVGVVRDGVRFCIAIGVFAPLGRTITIDIDGTVVHCTILDIGTVRRRGQWLLLLLRWRWRRWRWRWRRRRRWQSQQRHWRSRLDSS